MPRPTDAAVLLAIVVVVLGFGLLAVSASYEDTAESVDVTDEAFTQDVGNWTAVDGATEALAFEEAATVRNATGAKLVVGEDYRWADANGSVQILNSPNTTDGATATIDYGYDRRPEQAESMLAPLRTMFEAIGVLPLVLGLGLIFGAVRMFDMNLGSGTYGGRR